MTIGTILTIVATLVATWPVAWWQLRVAARDSRPSVANRAAYEMAYRGMLHNLAGQHINSPKQIKDGKIWLAQAAYMHKHSSRIGWNDAIDDIKEVLIASIVAVDPVMQWDPAFLVQQMRGKLGNRMGNDRPASQFREMMFDAIHSASFYREVVQAQIRRRRMIGNLAQSVGAIIMFAAAVLLIASAPGVWMAINELPPEVLAAEWQLHIKMIYIGVTAGFLGGGIALMAVRR